MHIYLSDQAKDRRIFYAARIHALDHGQGSGIIIIKDKCLYAFY